MIPEDMLQLNGPNIPLVINVTYLHVSCGRKMTWRLHIERNAAKAMRTYLMTYYPFKSEPLSTNTKFTL
jgi:hypothetical protein